VDTRPDSVRQSPSFGSAGSVTRPISSFTVLPVMGPRFTLPVVRTPPFRLSLELARNSGPRHVEVTMPTTLALLVLVSCVAGFVLAECGGGGFGPEVENESPTVVVTQPAADVEIGLGMGGGAQVSCIDSDLDASPRPTCMPTRTTVSRGYRFRSPTWTTTRTTRRSRRSSRTWTATRQRCSTKYLG